MRKILAVLVGVVSAMALAMTTTTPVGAWDLDRGMGHWAAEPYYGTGERYVWLIDHTTGSERAVVQAWVNDVNSLWEGNYSLPYIFYYTAESVGKPTGYNTCRTYSIKQTISVCRGDTYDPATGRYTNGAALQIGDDENGHAWAVFRSGLTGEYRNRVIKHELWHTYGLSHRTATCVSLMGGPQCGTNIGPALTSHDYALITNEYHPLR